jgi:hypothetical protein
MFVCLLFLARRYQTTSGRSSNLKLLALSIGLNLVRYLLVIICVWLESNDQYLPALGTFAHFLGVAAWATMVFVCLADFTKDQHSTESVQGESFQE